MTASTSEGTRMPTRSSNRCTVSTREGKARMEDREVLDFVTEMCATGEARRYGENRQTWQPRGSPMMSRCRPWSISPRAVNCCSVSRGGCGPSVSKCCVSS